MTETALVLGSVLGLVDCLWRGRELWITSGRRTAARKRPAGDMPPRQNVGFDTFIGRLRWFHAKRST